MNYPKNFKETEWDLIKKRWEAWWAHDIYDRPVLQVTAPKIKLGKDNEVWDSKKLYKEIWGSRNIIWESRPDKENNENVEMQWMDIDYLIKRTLYEIENT